MGEQSAQLAQSVEYMVDFLSITLDLEKPFVIGNKMNDTYIANNKTKIVKQSILCENYEIINFLLENFNIDEEIISDIIKDCYNFNSNENKNFHKLIKWVGENNIKLFEMTINKLINKIRIFDYNMIYVVKNIFNKFDNTYQTKQLFMESICKSFCVKLKLLEEGQYTDFLNFEYICLIMEICEENKQYINNINFYLKMFEKILINKYTDLNLLKKYIKYYNIKINILKKYLLSLNSNFIEILINSKSLEKITWFFDIIQNYTQFIKNTNYLFVFEASCKTNNVEIAKYIYNIIGLCGFEITKLDLSRILFGVIYLTRLNNENKNDIIYEIINLGIKPPIGYPLLTEYYNNLKIYSR